MSAASLGDGAVPPGNDPLEDVFDTYLPGRLAAHVLPAAISRGELQFVARGDSDAETRAWHLHAHPSPKMGGHFVPCAPGDGAKCRIMMAAADYVALARGELNLQMAFMRGQLKVTGDVGYAMELGALLA